MNGSCAKQADTFTEGRHQRYREAPEKLQQAVEAFLAQEPKLSCVLTLGDIINGRHGSQEQDIQDLDLILDLLQPLVGSVSTSWRAFGWVTFLVMSSMPSFACELHA